MGFENLQGKMGVALNVLCTCIVFMFVVTSAPVSQFRGKGMTTAADGTVTGASRLACVTVWGLKNDCTEDGYDYRPSSIACEKVASLFKAAEAFYIIASVSTCAAAILGAMFFIGYKTKILLYVLSALNVAATLIPWACMTGVWNGNQCGGSAVEISPTNGNAAGIAYGEQLRNNYKTSAGYGLTVSAFAIQVIGMALLIIL